ncbi:MAG: hypothetical protein KGM43_02720, partial [Planctomycetota bacterium]|nr:hypothetical protein [Planctomycetota bacterium]
MTIVWSQSMRFEGQSVDPKQRPAAKAMFFGKVRAQMEDSLLVCEEMTTYFDQPVSLSKAVNRDQKPAAALAKADVPPINLDDAGPGVDPGPNPEPKPEIALVDCVGKVTAITRKVDPDLRILVNQQKIVASRVIYDKRTGDFHVPTGPGIVYLWDRERKDNADNSAASPMLGRGEPGVKPVAYQTPDRNPNPGAARAPTPKPNQAGPAPRRTASRAGLKKDAPGAIKPAAPPKLMLTQVAFSREMRGRLGSGQEDDVSEPRWADFLGDVETLRATAPDANAKSVFNFDRWPQDAVYLTAQVMRVVSEPIQGARKGEPATRNFLKAWDNAFARTIDSTIHADRINYDSLKDLFYAFADDGREVDIVKQPGPGQPASRVHGEAMWFNQKSKESLIINPREFQFVDAQTGGRPGFVAPPKPEKLPKPDRPGLRRIPSSNFERNGFNTH